MPVISQKSLAILTLVTALLVPVAASAQRLSTSGTPNFGARSVTPGFTPDPIQIAVTSGGTLNVSSMNLGAGCTGFATAQPDYNFTLTGTSAFLRVFVDAGNEDTTLIINKANGQWACNDDSNGGRNPMVDMNNAGPGLYNVWIGSYQSGVQARGTLNITELASRRPGGGGATPTPPPSSGGGRLTTSGQPNYGARNVTPGFTPDPIQIAVTSGGTLDVSSMNLGQGCTGFATAQPDFNFTLTGTSSFLRVFVDAGAADTTLIINRANGQWACNDDSNGGTNPMVDMSNAGPGLYNVWIGSYQSGTRARGTLNITELASRLPGGSNATATTTTTVTTTPSGTTALTVSGRPNFGSRQVTPGFPRDPMRINVVSGGNVNATGLNLAAGCTGFVTAQPDLNFTLTGTSGSLRVYVDHVRGNGDTTLIINKPDGSWICNDDSYGGRNPTIDLPNAGPGLYNVWIGSYQSGVQARGRLNITELPGNHP